MKQSAPVKFDDLLAAYEWVSSSPGDCDALVSRVTGNVHWSSGLVELDEALPDDIEDARIYVPVPNRYDLDLGAKLALEFAQDRFEDAYRTVENFFRQRGAYRRFKDFLEQEGRLEAWYDYEAKATEAALREWAAEQGLPLQDRAGRDAG